MRSVRKNHLLLFPESTLIKCSAFKSRKLSLQKELNYLK
jgi:hypothetical protein